jgi:hypothetical protein
MPGSTLFSIIESPAHPDFSRLYRRLGFEEIRLGSMRKAISQLRKTPPAVVVAEFFYGYGNNYAGVNVSNLDVFLYSLQKDAPNARTIVLVEKSERQYVDRLTAILPVYAVLQLPVGEPDMEPLLQADALQPSTGRGDAP